MMLANVFRNDGECSWVINFRIRSHLSLNWNTHSHVEDGWFEIQQAGPSDNQLATYLHYSRMSLHFKCEWVKQLPFMIKDQPNSVPPIHNAFSCANVQKDQIPGNSTPHSHHEYTHLWILYWVYRRALTKFITYYVCRRPNIVHNFDLVHNIKLISSPWIPISHSHVMNSTWPEWLSPLASCPDKT